VLVQRNEDRPYRRQPDWRWRRLVATLLLVMVLMAGGVLAVMLGWIHPANLGS
jgi:hypothetical protein